MAPASPQYLGLDLPLAERFYFQMHLIRTVEETLLDLFTKGELYGTTHTCIGQEADAVGVLNAVDRERDMIFSNHRGHGHFLAYCGHTEGLLAEIMGRRSGVCGGRGGSQHLHWKNFCSTGVQGGFVPLAVGAAYAERKSGAIAVSFLGDGTLGEGTVYEGLNLASLWAAPVLFVVEDNGIAQTTPRTLAMSGSIAARGEAFGIASRSLDTTDVAEIHATATELCEVVRRERRPAWLHLKTVRLGPHSKGDDTRGAEEMDALALRDPLLVQRPRVRHPEALESLSRDIVERALAGARSAATACA